MKDIKISKEGIIEDMFYFNYKNFTGITNQYLNDKFSGKEISYDEAISIINTMLSSYIYSMQSCLKTFGSIHDDLKEITDAIIKNMDNAFKSSKNFEIKPYEAIEKLASKETP